MPIKYKKGYKYQLAETFNIQVSSKPTTEEGITSDFISLDNSGLLTIKKGYAWDGPSGPTIDTLNFMKGSLVHDALYQLIREKHLGPHCKDEADYELWKICRADGMSKLRAWYVWKAVQSAGGSAADPRNRKEIIEAGN